MRIGAWSFHVNRGMFVAAALLVAGGVLFVAAPEEEETLRTVGFGLVLLASVVYLVARILMLTRERRR